MRHCYFLAFDDDGDYIVYATVENENFIEHTRWLIPGTWLAD